MSSSSSSMRMTPKRGYLGVCAVIGLMILTLYMAFAFPFTLFQLKQSETTEIKSVIIIGRGGERSPTPESYFIGEEPPEELYSIGYEQLTNVGKERMFLLGKFLKLRYYQLLLNGNPRMLQARATAVDRSLESAQALIAGLNPPKDKWLWSKSKDPMDWQPKAIHSTSSTSDDLLSIDPNCFRINQEKLRWKNSTRYQQLVNEFRHDLQTLRANTGLEFEDDLEMLSQIEDSLRSRLAFKADVPAWYTKTFADRLAHISDVTTESRFSSADIKRLYVGRLLGEIVNNVNGRIRLDQELSTFEDQSKSPDEDDQQQAQLAPTWQPPLIGQSARTKCVLDEPKVFIYMTDKQRLAALMNSLQIYTSQPQFGSLLLIELHYEPINRQYFLRLFTISSTSPNVFPEPLRVNPTACVDSIECSSQQFEQNIQHLVLDRSGWQDACNSIPSPTLTSPAPQPLWPPEKAINEETTSSSSGEQQSQLPTDTGEEGQQGSSSSQQSSIPTQLPPFMGWDNSTAIAITTTELASISSIEKLDKTPTTTTEPASIGTQSSSAEVKPANVTSPGTMVDDNQAKLVPQTPDSVSSPSSLDTNHLIGEQDHQIVVPSSSLEEVIGGASKQDESVSERPKFHRDPRDENLRELFSAIDNQIGYTLPPASR